MENYRNPFKTFVVTMNGMTYNVRASDEDVAVCGAYRKYYKGKVNVYGDILWYLGTTKDSMTVREVE